MTFLFLLYLSLFLLLLLDLLLPLQGCAILNYCNGHGKCAANGTDCICYDGWGSWNDVTSYRAPDCSSRVCPSGIAWNGLPALDQNNTVTPHQLAECSNQGVCNRTTGLCQCFPGYQGKACNRYSCPNNCSGHGRCLSMERLAMTSDAQPLGPNFYYGFDPSDRVWDANMIFGCLCDSSWEVGIDSGQMFVSEWFGPDCSKRQGYCNYTTGTCKCLPGQWGANCAYYEGYDPAVEIIPEVYVDDTVVYYENLAKSLNVLADKIAAAAGSNAAEKTRSAAIAAAEAAASWKASHHGN
eukprot:scaffold369_cov177-Ochromonas_danica.AAC.45